MNARWGYYATLFDNATVSDKMKSPTALLGREFDFLLNSDIDHIQNVVRSGQFYEIEELELIAEIATDLGAHGSKTPSF